MHSILFEASSRQLDYQNMVGIFSKKRNRMRSIAISAKRMRDGDMWDGGRGYIGPRPVDDDQKSKETFAELRARFTGRNCIEEVTERMVDALLGRSPNWEVYNKKNVLSKSQQRQKDRENLEKKLEVTNRSIANLMGNNVTAPVTPEPISEEGDESEESTSQEVDPRLALAELLISEVWTEFNLKEVMSDAFDERLVTGEGKIRIRFSKKLLSAFDDEPANIEGEDELQLFSSVLKYITVEKADNDRTKVLDEDGDKVSVTRIESEDGKRKGVEISFIEDTSDETFIMVIEPNSKNKKKETGPQDTKAQLQENIPIAEIEGGVTDDSQPNEIIEKLKQLGDISTGFWLDGNILVHEMKGRPYITEVMLQQNRALNLDLSLAAGVLVESGFQEMILTNVSLKPGQTIQRGPTSTSNLVGLKSIDQHGTPSYTTPGVHFKDPTPLDTFDVGENLFYRQILNEARQAYILNSKDYNVSGESKIQSRQDFLKKAIKYKAPVDKTGGWLLTTFLHLIAALARKPKYFEGLAVMFDCRVSAGELSSDEKNTVILQQEKGLLDKETSMVLLGVEDPILTLDKVRLDKAEELEYLTKKAIIESSIQGKAGDDDELKTADEESVRKKNNNNVNRISPKTSTGEVGRGQR